MATITEDYVYFETGKLLKEKGFNEYCWKLYELGDLDKPILLNGFELDSDSKLWNNKYLELYKKEHSYINDICSAPTLQMAMKWLREVHGLFISIGNDDLDYSWQIFDVRNRTKDLDPTCLTDSYAGYGKYEQACEAAIKYCLENLI